MSGTYPVLMNTSKVSFQMMLPLFAKGIKKDYKNNHKNGSEKVIYYYINE
jgi:hypothetical protein